MPSKAYPTALPPSLELRRAVAEHRLATHPHHFRHEPALNRSFVVFGRTKDSPAGHAPPPPPGAVATTHLHASTEAAPRMVALSLPPGAPPAYVAVARVGDAALRLPVRAASALRTTDAVWPDGAARGAVLRSGWRAFVTDPAPTAGMDLSDADASRFADAMTAFGALLADDLHKPSNRVALSADAVVVLDNHAYTSVFYGPGADMVCVDALPQLEHPDLDAALLAASRARLYNGPGGTGVPDAANLFDLSAWPLWTKSGMKAPITDVFQTQVVGHGGVVFGGTGGTTLQTQAKSKLDEISPVQTNFIACALRNQLVQRNQLGARYVDIGVAGPDTVVLSTARAVGLRMMEVQTHMLYEAGATVVMLESKYPDDRVIQTAQVLRPSVLMGMSSNITQLAVTCLRLGVRLETIKRLLFGGEPLMPAQYDMFRRAFAADVGVFEMYGSGETGTYATRAPGDKQFRLAPDTMFPEVLLDDDSPAPYGVEGRLVLTNLTRTQFPMVRFDTGDRVVRQGPRDDEFALGGRMNGAVAQRFGSKMVDISDVTSGLGEPLCAALDGACEFQLVVREEGRCVRLAVYAAETDKEKLAAVEETMCRALRALFDEGSGVHDVGVTWLENWTELHRVPYTTKLLRFVNL